MKKYNQPTIMLKIMIAILLKYKIDYVKLLPSITFCAMLIIPM